MADNHDRTRVLVVWDRPGEISDILSRRFPEVDFEYAASAADVEAALARLRPEIVFTIKHERFPVEAHRAAVSDPGVKWIQVGGSGYEHLGPLDLDRVVLTNAAGVLAPFLAETIVGAMLAWNGNLYSYRDQQRDSIWRPIPFRPLRDATLLVVGMGAIGRCVAANARSLGMRVLGANRSPVRDAELDGVYGLADIEQALALADYVSVHLRLDQETRHFLDRGRLHAMKPGAFFINTSRGAVVDTAALVECLESGRLAGAYLDVFETEPLPADHPLWRMDNVLITPHAADQVADWPRRFTAFFADNLERWLQGRPLLNRVQPGAA